ncbi:MAG: helicase-exonuclease AddAB subunit AddA [Verrucomicrobia bacterium]|nr:helicase-exonuclease AddAB subunit AddA [Verrucomicrobiota bacterium]
MIFTDSQRAAIEATGNVLVSAGAGSGKTSALVECCLRRVLDSVHPSGLNEILMVTFTEAAAAEMKERIQARLISELNQTSDTDRRNQLEKETALLDTVAIGTLHSFCYRLIREHFHELGIDPQAVVLRQEQSALMMRETFVEILKHHYSGSTHAATKVQELIEVQGQGRDEIIRNLVFQIHNYTQTRPHPKAWFKKQIDHFIKPDPDDWIDWLLEAFQEWRGTWIERLREAPAENAPIQACAAVLANLPEAPSREQIAKASIALATVETQHPWPRGKKETFRKPFARFFEEAEFFRSVAAVSEDKDPLAEDWSWVRGQIETLLHLAEEFSAAFAHSKREQAVLDFHDLEQFALRLLWDSTQSNPSDLAKRMRLQYKSIFVDEYQDINPAQDKIIQALAREGCSGNRFLVGDVKQSIYRFRLADPGIFQNYRRTWSLPDSGGQVLSLSENFRSREGLLRFINPLFSELMRESIGGVPYESADALVFGAPDRRQTLAHAAAEPPRVEFHLNVTRRSPSRVEDPEAGPAELADSAPDPNQIEREASLVADRLAALIGERHPIWDTGAGAFREVLWSDMAILLRSLKNRGEIYAKEFYRRGIPLLVPQAGFYDNTEVSDLISLLQLLDNPLQDLPLLAVLRSPLVGLTLDQLVEIRVTDRHTFFWNCVQRWHELNRNVPTTPIPPADISQNREGMLPTEHESGTRTSPEDLEQNSAWRKIDQFLERFSRWRSLAREASLSQRLEAILDETLYEDWLMSLPDGEKRAANVRRLLSLTREFDPLQRCGLQRFLQWVENQRDSEIDSEPFTSGTTNAVSLTTIHRSKGLEYPVVVLAELGKRFNLRDLAGEIVLDEKYGLCPLVKPPFTGRYYPSLPSWLAAKRQRREALGEELRLLYVAMTRARDTLILAGTTSENTFDKWPDAGSERSSDQRILSANCVLDWLGPILVKDPERHRDSETSSSATGLFRWETHDSDAEIEAPADPAENLAKNGTFPESESIFDTASIEGLKRRLQWRYPFLTATAEPAKSAVTVLRKRFSVETDESNGLSFESWPPAENRPKTDGLSGADIGTAHHLFLQLIALDQLGTESEIRSEAKRLQEIAALSIEETEALNLKAVLNFWKSEQGISILAESEKIHRELPFTARFSIGELHTLLQPNVVETTRERDASIHEGKSEPGEFVLVQGIVDLAVIRQNDIWLLDYKTDAVSEASVSHKAETYKPQLRLYALALERIYKRPVTNAWLHFLTIGRTIEIS